MAHSPFSKTSDDDALHFLATEGFLPLALADHETLLKAYSHLFAKAAEFFELGEDSTEKTDSKIPGEKCIMTIKTSSRCPNMIHEQVKNAWGFTGGFMNSIIKAIARTLDLEADVFSTFVEPCISLPQEKCTPTLLRMFRYDRPQGQHPTVNAHRHKDLGLLSLVVGHSPGLHVLQSTTNDWISIEEDIALPPGSKFRSGGFTATLLGGETLALLSRGRYKAGEHGVVCAPLESDRYRFSIVYTLRLAVAPVFTKNFESGIVGRFSLGEQIDGVSSADIFEKIKKSKWNVNIKPEIRKEQMERQRQQKMALDRHD